MDAEAQCKLIIFFTVINDNTFHLFVQIKAMVPSWIPHTHRQIESSLESHSNWTLAIHRCCYTVTYLGLLFQPPSCSLTLSEYIAVQSFHPYLRPAWYLEDLDWSIYFLSWTLLGLLMVSITSMVQKAICCLATYPYKSWFVTLPLPDSFKCLGGLWLRLLLLCEKLCS